ncbi:hypothetical protein NIIDMKKI_76880 [Mycobacterium kansasii]|uniref:Uncharacterized protein n=1 Tax=Mycobacterium kansasii TaxID=1768 RepID=A0A7G1IQL2_MYCKA|nr:hypothetical protein NIIDMKKI_76880 [Mycobacterium kansasii]
MQDVEHPRDTGFLDTAQPQGAGQDSLAHLLGQRALRVDECQRHLAIQRGVQRLPEPQMRCAAVEDKQTVAAVGNAGAWNQVDVVPRHRRFRATLAWRIERNRPAGIGVAVEPVGPAGPRPGTPIGVGGNVGLKVVGNRPR